MSNSTKIAKKWLVISISLLFVITLMAPVAQGCGYINEDNLKELVGRAWALGSKIDELKEELDKKRSAIAAMQEQASNIEAEVQVAMGDVASAEGEIEDLQQEIGDKQAEVDAIQQQTAKLKQELDDIVGQLQALQEFTPNFCFAFDTLVLMADSSTKPISDVQAGDMVKAYDIETGQTVISDVMGTNEGEADYYYLINGDLEVTPPHPFFTAEGQWVKIADLKLGDKVRSFEGLVEITSIEKVNSGQRIGNISVRDFHNFFVSASGEDFYLVQEGSSGQD
ncbi:polymorphic toxin-type HINT domain-containing protein [Chloroflexota bacterium]